MKDKLITMYGSLSRRDSEKTIAQELEREEAYRKVKQSKLRSRLQKEQDKKNEKRARLSKLLKVKVEDVDEVVELIRYM